MNTKKAIVDTNVIVDVFTKRQPFFTDSYAILKLCESDSLLGYISASTATDIYYLVKKNAGYQTAEDALGNILSFLTVIDVTGADVLNAYSKHSDDFEDCLLGICATKVGINVIITRDRTGFNDSGIPFVSPSIFLKDHDTDDGNGENASPESP